MDDKMLEYTQRAADRILFALAERAGVSDDDRLAGVEEEHLETLSEDGAYGMEVWTVFEAKDPLGRTYHAHLPGRLDALIARTVRDHSVILGGE